MPQPVNVTAQRRVAGGKRYRGGLRLSVEHQLAGVARFLIAWLAAFLIVVALFSVFGQQLKAMSPQLRALTLSGVLTVAMNFLVMPTLTRLLWRFLPPGSTSATHSPG